MSLKNFVWFANFPQSKPSQQLANYIDINAKVTVSSLRVTFITIKKQEVRIVFCRNKLALIREVYKFNQKNLKSLRFHDTKIPS